MEIISAIAPARWGIAMGAATTDLLHSDSTMSNDSLFHHNWHA